MVKALANQLQKMHHEMHCDGLMQFRRKRCIFLVLNTHATHNESPVCQNATHTESKQDRCRLRLDIHGSRSPIQTTPKILIDHGSRNCAVSVRFSGLPRRRCAVSVRSCSNAGFRGDGVRVRMEEGSTGFEGCECEEGSTEISRA